MMHPKPGREADALVAKLEGAHPNLHAYLKAEVPAELHYREHRRVTPIVAWSDPGWYIYATHKQRRERRSRFALGMHGFDGREQVMHGLFVAHGPAFGSGIETPPLEAVHLYELMTAVLGLVPAPNDGERSRIQGLLAVRR